MKLSFTIPYPPTKAGKRQWAREYGLNAYYAGKHWSQRRRDAEYWHALVRAELRRQGIKPRVFEKPVAVTFCWNDNLDLDNHAVMGKMMVDALKGLLIAEDNRQHLACVRHLWHDEESILVEVEET